MISEEEIHRYHITERVYGPPLPILDDTYSHHGEVEAETSSKNKERSMYISPISNEIDQGG